MTIQEENISSFLIGLKELCIEHNLYIVGDDIELQNMPPDYEKRFFSVNFDGKDFGFYTQEELDFWVSKMVLNERNLIKGKL